MKLRNLYMGHPYFAIENVISNGKERIQTNKHIKIRYLFQATIICICRLIQMRLRKEDTLQNIDIGWNKKLVGYLQNQR